MEEQLDHLVQKIWKRYLETPNNQRLLVAISGIPGSGKTRLAAGVTQRVNGLASSNDRSGSIEAKPVAVFVPMDGYHLTRAQLSAMPDPQTAHFRRGAAFTFDAPAFVKLLRRVREPLSSETPTLYAPSFDHAIKDPVDDDIAIPASARVVIFEGNYLSMQKDEWAEISGLVDERWFVEVEDKVARERLAKRHAKAGIVESIDKGRERADLLDLVNGKEIRDNRGPIDELVISREEEAWKPET